MNNIVPGPDAVILKDPVDVWFADVTTKIYSVKLVIALVKLNWNDDPDALSDFVIKFVCGFVGINVPL